MKKKITVQKLVILALLVALNIVLARFLSIQAWNIRIGFTFLTIVCAAILYGPVEAAIVGGVGDFLGAMIFPSGPYFPGFTLTAVLTGLVHGLFLHKKVTILRVVLSMAIVQFGLGMILNSLWISVLYGKGFLALLPARAGQAVLLFIVQSVLTYVLNLVLFKRIKAQAVKEL